MDIAELLAYSVKNKASDLHLSSGLPPMIRVDGDIRRLNVPALGNMQLTELIYSVMSDHQRRDFEHDLEVDFSYEVPGLARFRVNCFHKDGGVGGAFRHGRCKHRRHDHKQRYGDKRHDRPGYRQQHNN